jgi:NhaA family Na+:H+ antiporter
MSSHAHRHPPVTRGLRKGGFIAALHSLLDHYLLVPIGAVIALGWANLGEESYFGTVGALRFPVNEIGMAFVFGLMAQEVLEATMPGGVLYGWRRWMLPIVGAFSGTALTSAAYLAYINSSYQEVLRAGWPVAAAVDLIFGYLVLRAIFRRHPAVPFFIILAVACNAIGLASTTSRHMWVDPQPGGIALMLVALGSAFLLRRAKVKSFWPYVAFCGPLSWAALYLDGLHPALALVPLVPFLPHAVRRDDFLADPHHAPHDSPRRFEHEWSSIVRVVLFLFALVNAGVVIRGYDAGTWGVLIASLLVKPAGIVAGLVVSTRFGLPLPARLHWRDVVVVATTSTAGFTFAMFLATSAYPAGPTLTQLKLGALGTTLGLACAVIAARQLGVGRFAKQAPEESAHFRLEDYVV